MTTAPGTETRKNNTANRKARKTNRSPRGQGGQGGRSQRESIEEQIADRIIQLLDEGQLPPWEKDWRSSQHGGLPRNAISMKPYRGINRWMTLLTQQLMGYNDPRWLTYKQAESLGGHVRKGEHSTTVVFWKRVQARREDEEAEVGAVTTLREEDEKPRSYSMLRAYRVFSVEQTQDCRLRELPGPELIDIDPLETAEAILRGMPDPPGIQHYDTANHAPNYSPSLDSVRVPTRGRYNSQEGYYNTLFHELTHSTGHPRRLHRFELDANADDLHAYGREELVAAMGSAMLAAHAGIAHESLLQRDASYIRHWRDAIQADKPMVIRAATLAQRAVDLILGEKPPEFTPQKPGEAGQQ